MLADGEQRLVSVTMNSALASRAVPMTTSSPGSSAMRGVAIGPHERSEVRIAIDELIDGALQGGDLLGELAPPEDLGQLGQHCYAGEQFDALLTRGLQQQTRRAASQDGRGDDVGVEHESHRMRAQLALFAPLAAHGGGFLRDLFGRQC